MGARVGFLSRPTSGPMLGLNVFSWAAMMFFSRTRSQSAGCPVLFGLSTKKKESKQQEEWHGFKHVYIFYNCLKKYESLYISISYSLCIMHVLFVHPTSIQSKFNSVRFQFDSTRQSFLLVIGQFPIHPYFQNGYTLIFVCYSQTPRLGLKSLHLQTRIGRLIFATLAYTYF